MFGSRLKQARIDKGLTQEQLSSLAGISISQISRFESEERTPRLNEIQNLSAILGVLASSLIGEDEANISDRRAQLVKRINSLSDEDVDLAAALLDRLTSKGL